MRLVQFVLGKVTFSLLMGLDVDLRSIESTVAFSTYPDMGQAYVYVRSLQFSPPTMLRLITG